MEKAIASALAGLCSIAVLAAEAIPDQILTFDGLGPVQLGMTVNQAEKALGAKFQSMNSDVSDESCWYTSRVDGVDPQIAYMIQNDKVVRIDIDHSEVGKLGAADPHVVTEKGIRIFSTEEQVKAEYGTVLEVVPHAYRGPEDVYLDVTRSRDRHGIRFEISDHMVIHFHAGLLQTVGLVEGCS